MSIELNEAWTARDAWDRFVEGHEQGRFCHLFNYGDVVRCYGYEPVHLAWTREGSLVAALPAAQVSSLFFGRKLVSQPFSEYGGLLVDPSLNPDDMASIYGSLDAYLDRGGKGQILEMHGIHGVASHQRLDHFVARNAHEVAVLKLDRPADQLWQKVVQYSVRKGVNKAQAQGVQSFEECTEAVIRERFYPLYLKSMKRLGVPPHSIAYYLNCFALLGGRMKIFWAKRNEDILAGLLGFVSGRRVNIINIVSDAAAWKFAPNDLIHWEFVKWAADAGLKYFDFGSVRYEGQRTYKKKWGTTFEEHAYYFLARDHSKIAQSSFSSSSSGMTRLSKVWSNYVPETVAALAGPLIRKHLVR